VLGHDFNEPIGESVDRVDDARIVLRPSSDGGRSSERRVELLEEGKGDCGDFNPGVQDVPCVNGTIELFCDSEGGNVPGIAIEVNVLDITANCDGFVRGDTVEKPLRMPPIGRNRIDEAYVGVLQQWIESLAE